MSDPVQEHPFIYLAMAECIRWKAVEFAVQKIRSTDILNRHTMINREQMAEDIAKYNDNYLAALSFIADSIDVTNSDCLKCKENVLAHAQKPF